MRFHAAMLPLILLAPAPVFAQTPTMPKPPALPAETRFADELAGRRLLFAARDAVRAAPALRLRANWTAMVDRNTRTTAESGTETIATEPKTRRLALTTERKTGTREVRRIIADADSAIATRFAAPSTREFTRLPVDPADSLERIARSLQATPATQAATLLLDPNWTVRGKAWADRDGVSVWQTEPTRTDRVDGNRAEISVTRRWRIDPKSKLPTRFEEWVVAEPNGGLRPRREFPHIAYRREEYTPLRTASPAALFAQTLPAGYRETPTPSGTAPAVDRIKAADPTARQLLARWAKSRERLLTYAAQIEVGTRIDDPSGRRNRQRGGGRNGGVAPLLVDTLLYKPGQMRLIQDVGADPNGGNGFGRGRNTRSLLVVADGKQVTVRDNTTNEIRRVNLNAPDDLGDAVRRAGIQDNSGALAWLFADPIDTDYDAANYRGANVVDGEPVEVVELVRNTSRTQGGDRFLQERTTTTIALAKSDGLPRSIERRTDGTMTDTPAEDQPPSVIQTARYRRVRVDEAPPVRAFEIARTGSRD